ncbi:DEAD/DEAH box helicase [Lactobacillaceae bacterium Scapto_B20]
MIEKISELYGRQMNLLELDPSLLLDPRIKRREAIKILNNHVECQRCGIQTLKSVAALPNDNYYCPNCINLGRVASNSALGYVNEPNLFPVVANVLTWDGQLTDAQITCAQRIIHHFKHHNAHLLWAVTGAGKTEMLFPGLKWALERQLRVGIASPRVDVCLELFPRIQAAFADTSMILLHGRQTEKYQYSQLTICTTHQLLRFYHAFDILIIDEVDSFPYVQNKGLHFAVEQAVKTNGVQLFLTATPSDDLLQKVKQNRLTISYLPLRFHRHLLPQIKKHYIPFWRERLLKRRLPKRLIGSIQTKVANNQPFLLFVPHVKDLQPIADVLHQMLLSDVKFTTVHSTDEKRLVKVSAMRNQELDFLVTTTILERGVTFSGIDVMVLGADEAIFSTAALVQIAGRVGRKSERPFGDVDFWIHSNANNVSKAIRQIEHMNKLGAAKLNHE